MTFFAGIQTVYFDVTGVLVTERPDPQEFCRLLSLDCTDPVIVSLVDHAMWAHRDQHDAGGSDAAFWNAVAGDCGNAELTDAQIQALVDADIRRMYTPNEEALRCVDRALEAGCTVGILANAPACVAQALRAAPWAKDRFSHFIFSGECGQRKPQSTIYRLAAQAAETEPEEILFIDDREKHLRGAQYFGMKTLQWPCEAQA
ncbi:HAD-IA family hydrolase [Schaalia sp. Marseille-Q2122]|uniref:HAD-IA family hydrolase n=1 Tax=Schaalia sp. Marseille-Q2122 TaxID=2736604 RepID=UPI00158CE961|nr:HAD-IA family hydrolase [Schaalia sp. Marseille-Q2122]